MKLLVWHAVGPTIFDENRAGFKPVEIHMVLLAFFMKTLNPFKVARPCAIVVFTSRPDIFNLSRGKIGGEAHFTDEGGDGDTLVLERKIQKDGNAFVRTALIFGGNAEGDVLPTVAPVFWKVVGDAVGALGEEEEDDIRAFGDDPPCVVAPLVGFFEKEIAGEADADVFSAFDSVTAVAGAL